MRRKKVPTAAHFGSLIPRPPAYVVRRPRSTAEGGKKESARASWEQRRSVIGRPTDATRAADPGGEVAPDGHEVNVPIISSPDDAAAARHTAVCPRPRHVIGDPTDRIG